MAWEFPSLLKDYINNYQSLPIPHTRVCGSDFMCLFACERAPTRGVPHFVCYVHQAIWKKTDQCLG